MQVFFVDAEIGGWYSLDDRRRLVEQVRRHGVGRDFAVRTRHPAGSIRSGRVTSQLVQLGGRPWMLSTVTENAAPPT